MAPENRRMIQLQRGVTAVRRRCYWEGAGCTAKPHEAHDPGLNAVHQEVVLVRIALCRQLFLGDEKSALTGCSSTARWLRTPKRSSYDIGFNCRREPCLFLTDGRHSGATARAATRVPASSSYETGPHT